jgi:hypothetical protein
MRGKVFKQTHDLVQMLTFLRIDQIYCLQSCLPAFIENRLQFLSELFLMQSLEFIIDNDHEFVRGSMQQLNELLLCDLR